MVVPRALAVTQVPQQFEDEVVGPASLHPEGPSIHMAVSTNWGSFLWVSLQEEPFYFGSISGPLILASPTYHLLRPSRTHMQSSPRPTVYLTGVPGPFKDGLVLFTLVLGACYLLRCR